VKTTRKLVGYITMLRTTSLTLVRELRITDLGVVTSYHFAVDMFRMLLRQDT
jgi:hypothetical protein